MTLVCAQGAIRKELESKGIRPRWGGLAAHDIAQKLLFANANVGLRSGDEGIVLAWLQQLSIFFDREWIQQYPASWEQSVTSVSHVACFKVPLRPTLEEFDRALCAHKFPVPAENSCSMTVAEDVIKFLQRQRILRATAKWKVMTCTAIRDSLPTSPSSESTTGLEGPAAGAGGLPREDAPGSKGSYSYDASTDGLPTVFSKTGRPLVDEFTAKLGSQVALCPLKTNTLICFPEQTESHAENTDVWLIYVYWGLKQTPQSDLWSSVKRLFELSSPERPGAKSD